MSRSWHDLSLITRLDFLANAKLGDFHHPQRLASYMAASGIQLSVSGSLPSFYALSCQHTLYIMHIRDTLLALHTTASITNRLAVATNRSISTWQNAEVSNRQKLFFAASEQNGATQSKCLAVPTAHTTFAHDNRSAAHTLTIVVT